MPLIIQLKNTIFNNANLPTAQLLTAEGFLGNNLFASYLFNGGLSPLNAGGPALSNNGAATVTDGLLFDGVNDYLEIASKPTGQGTYLIAYKNTNATPSSDAILTDNVALGDGYRLQTAADTRLSGWHYNTSASNVPDTGALDITASVVNVWNIAVIAFDEATGKVKIALPNQNLYDEETYLTALKPSSGKLRLGHQSGHGAWFAGEMAGFLAYDKYLSNDDIKFNSDALVNALPNISFAS